jgi:hypothetical protein
MRQPLQLADMATTPDDLVAAADLVRALGAAAGGIDVAERILERIQAGEPRQVDRVGSTLIAPFRPRSSGATSCPTLGACCFASRDSRSRSI